jgi:putative ABC transport system substrate-binding protein
MSIIRRFILIITISSALLTGCEQPQKTTTKIGLILPLEHTAMREITAGFTDTLKSAYPQPVEIKVENAQNDPNLLRAIIQQMRDSNYDLIVPVGTSTTQMTIAMIHNKPILSLASGISAKERQQLKPCNVAVVHDEISSASIINFIHQLYPNLKNITLIHSADDKVFPEVKAAIAAGKNNHIEIQALMATSLPELTAISQTLSPNTQAILILKDSLIVSGISTLAKVAQNRHIPLMTSDQGSVEDGGGLALGVHEKQIGSEGANLAVEILNDKAICSLPITEMNKLTVFINFRALTLSMQNVPYVVETAKKLGFQVEIIDKPTGR